MHLLIIGIHNTFRLGYLMVDLVQILFESSEVVLGKGVVQVFDLTGDSISLAWNILLQS